MNREDIIRMAREAGIDSVIQTASGRSIAIDMRKIERFAALVAAHEREACAAMAEAFHRNQYDFTGDLELHEAIRARSKP